MITCRELVALLCDFIDGELSAEQCQHIQQHLDVCPPCVVYIETYRVTIRLSRKLPSEPIPATLAEKLKALLEQRNSGERGV